MKRNETINETAKFLKEKNQAVHITLISGQWLNGLITSISDDRLVIEEERFGEMLIFFDRIKDDGIIPREVKE